MVDNFDLIRAWMLDKQLDWKDGDCYYVPFSDSGKLKMNIDVWPTLKDHQFIQVKDPYSALWEIEHWFDSHARPDEAIVPVGDDITRLQAYGFDKKTSFRKAKEK